MSSYKPRKELITDWVTALRSGGYEQGQFRLAEVFSSGNVKYCCLGVLCEIAQVPRKTLSWLKDDYSIGYYQYASHTTVLPPILEHHINLDTGKLIQMNDDGLSFPQIADAIEAMFATSETPPKIYKGIDK